MQNKLFHRLIATFVLITVSIPDITLAGDHQPQTRSQECETVRLIPDEDDLNDDPQSLIAWLQCDAHAQIERSEVQTRLHQEGNRRERPLRINSNLFHSVRGFSNTLSNEFRRRTNNSKKQAFSSRRVGRNSSPVFKLRFRR